MALVHAVLKALCPLPSSLPPSNAVRRSQLSVPPIERRRRGEARRSISPQVGVLPALRDPCGGIGQDPFFSGNPASDEQCGEQQWKY